MTARPIIIIGPARSGTRFLRDTLSACQAVSCVPYDVNFVWRRGNEQMPDDELGADAYTRRQRTRIRKTLYAQAGCNGRASPDVLLEKTVSNCLRINSVDQVFPEARYIVLLRGGLETVASAYRAWQAPADSGYLLRKALTFPWADWRYAVSYAQKRLVLQSRHTPIIWGPAYRGIAEDLRAQPLDVVVARQWRNCVERALDALQRFPVNRVLHLRYEDLIANDNWIAEAMRFMGVADSQSLDQVRSTYAGTVRRDVTTDPESMFTAEQLSRITAEIAPAEERIGYRAQSD